MILSQFFWGDCGSSRPLVPALYVFGDSLFDGGNNNWLPTLAKANYPPYGQNFPKGQSTGRFTNGKLVVDFIGTCICPLNFVVFIMILISYVLTYGVKSFFLYLRANFSSNIFKLYIYNTKVYTILRLCSFHLI